MEILDVTFLATGLVTVGGVYICGCAAQSFDGIGGI
jgi:hypothetical protein